MLRKIKLIFSDKCENWIPEFQFSSSPNKIVTKFISVFLRLRQYKNSNNKWNCIPFITKYNLNMMKVNVNTTPTLTIIVDTFLSDKKYFGQTKPISLSDHSSFLPLPTKLSQNSSASFSAKSNKYYISSISLSPSSLSVPSFKFSSLSDSSHSWIHRTGATVSLLFRKYSIYLI
jgi:hypothetical protein